MTAIGGSERVRPLAWSPSGDRIAAVYGGQGVLELDQNPTTLRIWDAASGHLICTLAGGAGEPCAWSPDGRHIVATSRGGSNGGIDSVGIWDAWTGKLVSTHASGNVVKGVAWLPGGRLTCLTETDAGVQTWDAASGRVMSRFTLSVDGGSFGALDNNQAEPATGWWSSDGGRLATKVVIGVIGDIHRTFHTVRIWNSTTGRIMNTLVQDEPGVAIVDVLEWSPDGRRLAAATYNRSGSTVVWDAVSGEIIHRLAGAGALAWSPDSRRLANLGPESGATIQIWDPSTGTPIRKTSKGDGTVTAMGWSPVGDRLAIGFTSGEVKIWRANV
jgi:WD40 repeat protein